jgi:hypothetical protein
MTDRDRYKLLGTYRTPRIRIGTVLSCEARDCDVIVVGYSDGPIPWPVGRRKGRPAHGPVVYGALAEAVYRESNQAVAHWWGVGPAVVSHWRRALGVGVTTAGTERLRKEYAREDWFIAARARGQAKARDPERRKLSEAFRGRKPQKHVIEAARKARTGKPHSPEVRAKISAIRKAAIARGEFKCPGGRLWTPAEDELVRTMPAPVAARKIKRSLRARRRSQAHFQ